MDNHPTERYSYIAVNEVTLLYGCVHPVPNCNSLQPYSLRGVNLMNLDMDSCKASNWKWFDTYSTYGTYANDPRFSGHTPEFRDYLSNQKTKGTIVLGMTSDEPRSNLGPALNALLEAGIDVKDVGHRGMFAFVMQKGYPAKTVLVKSNSRPRALTLTVIVTQTGTGSNYSYYPRLYAYCINE